MLTVSIKKEYADILTTFGEPQKAIDLALQRFSIEQITTKIAELRQKEAVYQLKYGMDYPTFTQRIAEDELFINQVKASASVGCVPRTFLSV
jgi:glycerol dehydrogenase-like iron-containing ADH family enzyme